MHIYKALSFESIVLCIMCSRYKFVQSLLTNQKHNSKTTNYKYSNRSEKNDCNTKIALYDLPEFCWVSLICFYLLLWSVNVFCRYWPSHLHQDNTIRVQIWAFLALYTSLLYDWPRFASCIIFLHNVCLKCWRWWWGLILYYFCRTLRPNTISSSSGFQHFATYW